MDASKNNPTSSIFGRGSDNTDPSEERQECEEELIDITLDDLLDPLVGTSGGEKGCSCTTLHCACDILGKDKRPGSVLTQMEEASGLSLATFSFTDTFADMTRQEEDPGFYNDDLSLGFDMEPWDSSLGVDLTMDVDTTGADQEAIGGVMGVQSPLGHAEEIPPQEESGSDCQWSSDMGDLNNELSPMEQVGPTPLSEQLRLYFLRTGKAPPRSPPPPPKKRFYCEVCERRFDSEFRYLHHVEHHRKCVHCDKLLDRSTRTTSIFKRELNITVELDLCEGCRERERRIAALARGATETIVRPPPETVAATTNRSSSSAGAKQTGQEKGHLGMEWDIEKYMRGMAVNEKKSLGKTSTLVGSGQQTSSEGTSDAEGVEGQAVFMCKLCPATFLSRYLLDVHARGHLEVCRFTCVVCGQGFRAKHLLTQHHVDEHSPKKEFTCRACGREFTSLWILRAHERNMVQCAQKISKMEATPKCTTKKQ